MRWRALVPAVGFVVAFGGSVQARESFVQISAGGAGFNDYFGNNYFHTCGVTRAGGVKCWGHNYAGKLGDGTNVARLVPVDVVGLTAGVKAVAAGGYSTCALLHDGTVKCWGSNRYGQLGDGSRQDALVPRDVPLLKDVVSIAAGGDFNCALTSDSRTLCWGHISDRLVGSFWEGKLEAVNRLEPTEVPGLDGARQISASSEEAGWPDWWLMVCGIDGDGAVRCTNRIDEEARVVPGLERGAVSVAAGFQRACALTSTDGVKCWSFGVVETSNDRAVAVAGLEKDVVSLAAGDHFTCALMVQGRVKCRGAGGYLGDGTSMSRQSPVEVAGLRGVVSISAGPSHTCALLGDGQAYCWGLNGNGQLGSGQRGDFNTNRNEMMHLTPVGVVGFSEGVLADSPGPLTGLWWNPGESGWGLHLVDRRNTSVATLYMYDAMGHPKWYIASNCVFWPGLGPYTENNVQCSSALHEAEGPRFFDGPFDPRSVRLREVGQLKLQLKGRGSAIATITIDAVTRTVDIQRYAFAAGANPLDVDYSDLWWNPQESGWGVAIDHQAAQMFLTWYVYEEGKPVWYYVADCVVAATGCAGTLYRASGPGYAVGFDPSHVHSVAVGSASVSFSDPNTATLSYSIGGITGARALTRYRF